MIPASPHTHAQHPTRPALRPAHHATPSLTLSHWLPSSGDRHKQRFLFVPPGLLTSSDTDGVCMRLGGGRARGAVCGLLR